MNTFLARAGSNSMVDACFLACGCVNLGGRAPATPTPLDQPLIIIDHY